jgi:HPt (histidine-containing phosphotransfer) domain-containing protein
VGSSSWRPPNPLLDEELVAELTDDLGEAGFATLLGVYRGDVLKRVGELRSAIAAADIEAARRLLHAMAGASASIGATALAAYCRAAMHAETVPASLATDVERGAAATLAAFGQRRAAA